MKNENTENLIKILNIPNSIKPETKVVSLGALAQELLTFEQIASPLSEQGRKEFIKVFMFSTITSKVTFDGSGYDILKIKRELVSKLLVEFICLKYSWFEKVDNKIEEILKNVGGDEE